MDIQADSLLGSENILLGAMNMEENSLFGNEISLPSLEDEMFLSKMGSYGDTSTLRICDSASEQKEFPTFAEINFDEEQFFRGPVLNMNGGPGPCLTKKYNENLIDAKPSIMKYFKPDMDALSEFQDFVEFDAKLNSLTSFPKPIEETDQLVKLKYEQKPFFHSRRDVITQKPLDMVRKTGRMAFEMADVSLIEKNSKLRMFLRDKATVDGTILELSKITVDKKNKCNCFSDHYNSLFCLRSRYEEAVKITWSTNRSYVFIDVDDVEKFELLFAPLITQSRLKNHSSIIMQLVFQMELEDEILEQSYYIKFLMSPKRDIDNFIKTLVKERYVNKTYLEEVIDSSFSKTSDILKVQFDEKYEKDFKLLLKSIGGEIIFQ